jgi:hypothetical protein
LGEADGEARAKFEEWDCGFGQDEKVGGLLGRSKAAPETPALPAPTGAGDFGAGEMRPGSAVVIGVRMFRSPSL